MKIDLQMVKQDIPGTGRQYETYQFYITKFDRKERRKLAKWIDDNCESGVLMWGHGKYERYMKFYNDNDATLFKLSWL